MRETDKGNLKTVVILNTDKTVHLKELLPYFDWWQEQS
jgi:hypothetical protein